VAGGCTAAQLSYRYAMEIAPQGVARLFEEAPCVLGVCVRPEICHELVTTDAAAAGSGQQRQQRQRLALMPGATGGHTVYGNREAAERDQVDHTHLFGPSRLRLTGF